MADALTIYEIFGNMNGHKLTFIGDGNSVAVSLMHATLSLGDNFTLASDEGYDLDHKALEIGHKIAERTRTNIKLLRDPHVAVKNAQVIYTDTWTSIGQESESKKREQVFAPFQVNDLLVKEADPKVIVMHCLPVHRGQDLTDSVADSPHNRLVSLVHKRMHAQKAVVAYLLGAV
jgi:ornithine carbamoyltransferase